MLTFTPSLPPSFTGSCSAMYLFVSVCVSLGPVSISLLKEQLPFALTHTHIDMTQSLWVHGESYVMSLLRRRIPLSGSWVRQVYDNQDGWQGGSYTDDLWTAVVSTYANGIWAMVLSWGHRFDSGLTGTLRPYRIKFDFSSESKFI